MTRSAVRSRLAPPAFAGCTCFGSASLIVARLPRRSPQREDGPTARDPLPRKSHPCKSKSRSLHENRCPPIGEITHVSEGLLAHLIGWINAIAAAMPFALFRGCRDDRQRHASQPAVEKLLQPGAFGRVMDCAIGEVVVARPRARQFEPP